MTTIKNPTISSSQLNELKLHLKLMQDASEQELSAKWNIIKHMQADLELPDLPVEELVEIFTNLEEVRAVFKLKSVTFNHLNDILTEINDVKKQMDIPDDTALVDVLPLISSDIIIETCGDSNSRLAKLLRFC